MAMLKTLNKIQLIEIEMQLRREIKVADCWRNFTPSYYYKKKKLEKVMCLIYDDRIGV